MAFFKYKRRFREPKGCITRKVTKPSCLYSNWFSTLGMYFTVFYIHFSKYSALRSVLVVVFSVVK